jgi:NAD(P)-dependent dehydrogenase (short-subunit alcohol dehydrogenase family)
MSANAMPWLAGRRALLVGAGAAADAVAAALVTAGATLRRADAAIVEGPDIATVFDAGEVDLLVHAGTPLPAVPAETIGLDDWRGTFSADLDGRFLFAAEFARRIIAAPGRHGAILFLMPGMRSHPLRAAAASAHGALDNLVKSLGVEWGRDGIRVNAIASDVIRSFAAASQAQIDSLGNLAAWLLSDYSAYVTGTVAGIDEL